MAAPEKKFTLAAAERIKSRKIFDHLFDSGNTLKNYPVRLIWKELHWQEGIPLKCGVSVPKRYMPRAVDRNRMKRLVRESFRLNKIPLAELLISRERTLALLFIVQSKTPLSFNETQEKIILLLQRLTEIHDKTAQ